MGRRAYTPEEIDEFGRRDAELFQRVDAIRGAAAVVSDLHVEVGRRMIVWMDHEPSAFDSAYSDLANEDSLATPRGRRRWVVLYVGLL